MTAYVLLALMTLPSGQVHEFAVDHSLSLEDCRRAVVAGMIFDRPPTRQVRDAVLTCRPQ